MTEKTLVWSLDEGTQSGNDLLRSPSQEGPPSPLQQRVQRRKRASQRGKVLVSEQNGLLTVEPHPKERADIFSDSSSAESEDEHGQRPEQMPGDGEEGGPQPQQGASNQEEEVDWQDSLIDAEFLMEFGDPPLEPMEVIEPVHNEGQDDEEFLRRLWKELESDEDPSQAEEGQQLCKVNVHPHCFRKKKAWKLTVKKKWLILGDSNLARIPGHAVPHLQIDSFPGANFRHADNLIAGAEGDVVVEKLVLSFGINSRQHNVKSTAIKNLQAMVRKAKERFPSAEIFVPLINFSENMVEEEQRALGALNSFIFTNMLSIALVPDHVFRTERDNIHWTTETAVLMLEHWLYALNTSSP